MIKTTVSEPFNERTYYVAHFMDAGVWEPYVRQVCGRHGYACSTVRAGVAGTFPTFICELSQDGTHGHPRIVVVKFFGPLFDGRHSFQTESNLSRWIQQQPIPIPSPEVLAEGRFDVDWDYIIFEFVDGRNVGEVRDELSREDWTMIAHQMGEYMHQLHMLTAEAPPELPGIDRLSWNSYVEFLTNQRQTCHSRHRAWNDLSVHWLEQLEPYVLPAEELVDRQTPAHVIHADLTADHLFGSAEHGRWHTHAIIDWGDAKIGNVLQELIPVYLDLFRGDRKLLEACLEAYQLPEFYRQDFPRKALSMLLLDIYPLPDYFLDMYRRVGTLDELAELMYGLSMD